MAVTQAPELAQLGTKPRLFDYVRSVWQRREFALEIPRAELRAQHRDTVLGGLWHVLDPLLLVGVYYVVFKVILDVSRGVDNFVGFLAIGVFTFHFTSKSVRAGARSIVANEGLLRAVSFPRAILPVSVVFSEFAALVYAMGAMYLIVLGTGERPAWTWLLMLPIVLLQLMFNIGAAMFVARLADRYRDVLQVLPYTLRIWGYMSGVFYDLSRRIDKVPALGFLVHVNPAYLYMTMARNALLENRAPTAEQWLVLIAWGVGALLGGLLFFMGREHEYGGV